MSDFRRRIMMGISKPKPLYPDPYVDDGLVWAYVNVDADGTYRIANGGPSNSGNGWKSLEIDGVAVAGNRDQYLTAGEHLLKFTLSNTAAINANIFRGTSRIYSRIYLPNTITIIDDYSFYDCQSNARIYADTTKITTIGTGVFYHARVYFGKLDFQSLTSLGQSAFQDYYAANKHTLKDLGSITSIPSNSFRDTVFSDSTYIIPSMVTSIGGTAYFTNNNNLRYFVYPTTPPTLGSQVFRNTPAAIYVPAESVEDYKAASGWSSYANRIQAIPE